MVSGSIYLVSRSSTHSFYFLCVFALFTLGRSVWANHSHSHSQNLDNPPAGKTERYRPKAFLYSEGVDETRVADLYSLFKTENSEVSFECASKSRPFDVYPLLGKLKERLTDPTLELRDQMGESRAYHLLDESVQRTLTFTTPSRFLFGIGQQQVYAEDKVKFRRTPLGKRVFTLQNYEIHSMGPQSRRMVKDISYCVQEF